MVSGTTNCYPDEVGNFNSIKVLYHCRLTPFALCGRDRLQDTFPSEDQITFKYHVEGELEEPITHIGWRGGESTLSVETVHTYPHEGQGVRSNSTFEICCGG